jgi:hypothetical protein
VTTDAINTTGALVQMYDELIVNIGPTDGSAPGETETFEDVYCTRVVQSAGGSRMDYAELVYGLYDHLQDRDQPSGFSRRIHVRMPDAGKTLLADCDYVGESAGVQQSGESLTATAQQRQYFFGGPLKYYDVHSPLSDLNAEIEDDIVFNPTVDDKTVFNMSERLRPGESFYGHLWTHPEIADTEKGEIYQEQVREEWTLKDAVESICELLNPAETFIQNTAPADLIVLNDAPPLRAVTIPLGTYLPQALDMLLLPLGYSWWVNYTDEITPFIVFFKIGEGEEKTLFMQRVGESLNLEWSNLNQFQISNSIGDSFNDVLAMGELEEAELTFPLFPAWHAAYDETSLNDLDKASNDYAGKETAWRLWIANEAGDIDPAVERLGQTPTVPDLRDVFTKYIPHRRTIGEPLTFLSGTQDDDDDNEKQRRPIVVEYSVDGGTVWNPLPDEWSVKLCPNQIGILFDNKRVPEELYTAGDQARVRITGTIFGDSRIQYHATKQDWAVNGRTVQQVVKRPDKFQKRWRQATGDYASVLTGPHDEKDDSDEIEDFATKLRDQNHYAEVDCEFRLPGWHLEYKIGDLISKIEGREINLDAAPANAPDYRFPQIVERRFEMTSNGPSTVLIVDRGVQQS